MMLIWVILVKVAFNMVEANLSGFYITKVGPIASKKAFFKTVFGYNIFLLFSIEKFEFIVIILQRNWN